MLLRIVENDAFRDVHIKEGEMFLLPGMNSLSALYLDRICVLTSAKGNTPHSPIRFANTTGLVMERVRPADSMDRLRWYCSKGNHDKPTIIAEEVFHCTDLGTQLKPLIDAWMGDETKRKCKVCGLTEDPK